MAAQQIRSTCSFRVPPGRQDDVATVVDQLRAVSEGVPVASFDATSGTDGASLDLTFTFADHDALDASVRRLGPVLAGLAEVAPLTDLHFHGELRTAARSAFASLGATFHA